MPFYQPRSSNLQQLLSLSSWEDKMLAPPPRDSLHYATNGKLCCHFTLCVSPDGVLWAAVISRLTSAEMSGLRSTLMIYDGACSGPLALMAVALIWLFDYSTCTRGPERLRHAELWSEASGAPRCCNEAKLP